MDSPAPADDRRFYVYVANHPVSGAPLYVGKGNGRRIKAHLSCALSGRHHNPHLANAIRKYGPLAFEVIRDGMTEAEAFALEIELIAKHGRSDKKAGTLCNLTDGGEGCAGRPISAETRGKLRAANLGNKHCLGRVWTAEMREKIGAKQRGRKMPDEQRAKLSAALMGRKGWAHTSESKAKLRAAHLGKPKGPQSPEVIAKRAAVNTGKKRSAETCARIGAGHKGKAISAECRAKLSAALKGRKRTAEQIEKTAAALRGQHRPPEVIAKALATKASRKAARIAIAADLFLWADVNEIKVEAVRQRRLKLERIRRRAKVIARGGSPCIGRQKDPSPAPSLPPHLAFTGVSSTLPA